MAYLFYSQVPKWNKMEKHRMATGIKVSCNINKTFQARLVKVQKSLEVVNRSELVRILLDEAMKARGV
jgi:hypothetical protein